MSKIYINKEEIAKTSDVDSKLAQKANLADLKATQGQVKQVSDKVNISLPLSAIFKTNDDYKTYIGGSNPDSTLFASFKYDTDAVNENFSVGYMSGLILGQPRRNTTLSFGGTDHIAEVHVHSTLQPNTDWSEQLAFKSDIDQLETKDDANAIKESIDAKADKASVDSQMASTVKTVNGVKPTNGNVQIDIPKNQDLTAYAKTADVDSKLATKANSSDVYSKKDVDSKLSTKADQTSVNTQIASTVKTVNGVKPTNGNVSISIPSQPDLTPYAKTSDVNLSLNSKTNLSDFNALKGEAVNKADKSTTYSKTEVDSKVNTINTNLSRLNGLSSTLSKPDFNALTSTGVFYIESPDGGKNYPVGSWGTLVVSNGQNARIEQVYYPDNNDAPFIRQDVSGNWKPWVQLAKASDVTNLHNSVAGSLNAKADKTSVYSKADVDGKVNTINSAIGSKAGKTDISNLQSMISSLQAKLSEQENTINSLKASSHSFTAISQADYDKLTDAQKKNGWYAIG